LNVPDFLIIGGMRCGTTTLHELLRRQSSIFFPETKEVHFFDKRNLDLGVSVEDYSDLFSACPVNNLTGEATPDYLSTEGCDEFIFRTIPDVKLVIILRNPLDRVWSHYQFSVEENVETLELMPALIEENKRLKIKSDHSDIFFSYLQRSRYIEHLIRFERLFGRDQMKVVFFEELIQNPQQVLSDILGYLGVAMQPVLEDLPHLNKIDSQPLEPTHKTGVVKRILTRLKIDNAARKRKLTSSDRKYLQSYFFEHNQKLQCWLGRPLPW